MKTLHSRGTGWMSPFVCDHKQHGDEHCCSVIALDRPEGTAAIETKVWASGIHGPVKSVCVGRAVRSVNGVRELDDRDSRC